MRDTIVVFRATDGAEVFRRYLPTYSRTNVVFLGSDYFVYSDAGGAHVIRMSANGL